MRSIAMISTARWALAVVALFYGVQAGRKTPKSLSRDFCQRRAAFLGRGVFTFAIPSMNGVQTMQWQDFRLNMLLGIPLEVKEGFMLMQFGLALSLHSSCRVPLIGGCVWTNWHLSKSLSKVIIAVLPKTLCGSGAWRRLCWSSILLSGSRLF